jgi:predicted DNA-binding transcriptional regulator YafY
MSDSTRPSSRGSMSRPIRLLELVQVLSGRRARPLSELVSRFDVSERTLYRDLAELSRQRIPVAHDEHGYRLLETATLRPLNVTAEEHAILRLALSHPSLRRQPALARVLELLESKLDAATARLEEGAAGLCLAPVDRSGPATADALPQLAAAVRERRPVEIDYASLSGGTRRWRTVEPWQVVQRGEAWYLVARDNAAGEPRVFRLDRVAGVRGLPGRVEVPAGFDVERFFAGSWRAFRRDEDHAVHLVFAARLAPLLVGARHAADERVKVLRDGRVDYRVRVNALEELARWVAGFGGGVEVRAPEELAEQVRAIARGTLETLGA